MDPKELTTEVPITMTPQGVEHSEPTTFTIFMFRADHDDAARR